MFNQTLTPIIGIDLGLNKSVLAIFTPIDGQIVFRTIPTNAEELADLFAEFQQATFVIEACALTGWVYDLATASGVRCMVANTAGRVAARIVECHARRFGSRSGSGNR
jgi:hypothetical protein